MFHRVTDASKVALVALVERLRDDGAGGAGRLLDVQWVTPHLESVGAIETTRANYLQLLDDALELALPSAFV
jgi:leucyl/phenylalanyl-tRNA--protein transferase